MRQKTQSIETEQVSESDSGMEGMLKFSDQKFNMLRDLMEKVDSIQEKMSNIIREIEILEKNTKKNARDKTTTTPLTEIKNAFDGLHY